MDYPQIVDRFLDAYNQKDLDTFIGFLHPDFESYLLDTGVVLNRGKQEAVAIYQKRFAEVPGPSIRVLSRMVNDNVVIDDQIIDNFEGGKGIHAFSILEFQDGLIRKAHFVRRQLA